VWLALARLEEGQGNVNECRLTYDQACKWWERQQQNGRGRRRTRSIGSGGINNNGNTANNNNNNNNRGGDGGVMNKRDAWSRALWQSWARFEEVQGQVQRIKSEKTAAPLPLVPDWSKTASTPPLAPDWSRSASEVYASATLHFEHDSGLWANWAKHESKAGNEHLVRVLFGSLWGVCGF
jgi:hypothetical protein